MRKRTVLLTLGGLFLLAALALTARNLRQEARAQTAAEQTLQTLAPIVQTAADAQTPLEAEAVPADEQVIPDYQLDPQMEMPVTTIDGVDYIGVLEIPALELELPIMSQWSYPNLKIAPCRYQGSAYQNDLILLAHNYSRHFGQIHTLEPGDTVCFTDADGTRFMYEVSLVEQLERTAIEEMESGDWDLTLFTCTVGGAARVTVRCQQTDDNAASR